MFVGFDKPSSPKSDYPQFQTISAAQNIFSSENIFYPKERGLYQFQGVKFFGQQICFRAKNDDALFYNITLTKEGGKKGIAIDSEYIQEMKDFLTQNDIPINDFGSDCQYHDSCGLAHYYTTNVDVCIKLSRIILKINKFDLTGFNNSIIEEFKNF